MKLENVDGIPAITGEFGTVFIHDLDHALATVIHTNQNTVRAIERSLRDAQEQQELLLLNVVHAHLDGVDDILTKKGCPEDEED